MPRTSSRPDSDTGWGKTANYFRRTFAVLAGAVVLLAGGLTSASATTTGAPPAAGTCAGGLITEYAATCFQWVGDKQWIEDRDANGWAAVVHSQTNYGKDRYCQARPAAEGWNYCDYDHIEGKCVRFMLYELKDGVTRNPSIWSAWIGTEYGSPC
jgi:hypothetical protein